MTPAVYMIQNHKWPNPQVVPGLVWFMAQYYLSILFNLFLAGYCLFIIVRYFLSLKRQAN